MENCNSMMCKRKEMKTLVCKETDYCQSLNKANENSNCQFMVEYLEYFQENLKVTSKA